MHFNCDTLQYATLSVKSVSAYSARLNRRLQAVWYSRQFGVFRQLIGVSGNGWLTRREKKFNASRNFADLGVATAGYF